MQPLALHNLYIQYPLAIKSVEGIGCEIYYYNFKLIISITVGLLYR